MKIPAPDCWVETSVRCKGGKNMDGFYILGHYATVQLGREALNEHLKQHPKAFAFLICVPGCPAV